ncbi:MAG: hypothetical protein A2Y56_05915 [Candidatus Aminicenantes bacterium RBG_13_63_10]|nr:MAG: hypothetical protein A2Y56_05915 [Candidatus Aminicenantes bacterium RBG_13_63_10]
MTEQKGKSIFNSGSRPLLAEEELFSGIGRVQGSSLFLGKYSLAEVIAVLGHKNFFREAKKRGLWPLEFNIDSSEYPLQRFQIFFGPRAPENIIVDLKIKEGLFQVKSHLTLGLSSREYRVLVFDWLTLQNPLLKFGPNRSPLPGQEHPGLGLSRKVIDIFTYLARLMDVDGLLAFPAFFHNAVLFSKFFYFVNPDKAGEIESIRRAFRAVSLKKLAWAVHWGCLRDKSGKPYEWAAEEQIYPLSKSLRRHFRNRIYRMKSRYSLKRHHYSIDWECYRQKASGIPGLQP